MKIINDHQKFEDIPIVQSSVKEIFKLKTEIKLLRKILSDTL